jgi:hypothetical protein
MDERDSRIHLSHCNQGDYEDSCKYGEEDCPAIFYTTTRLDQDTCVCNTEISVNKNSLLKVVRHLDFATGMCPEKFLAAFDELRALFTSDEIATGNISDVGIP